MCFSAEVNKDLKELLKRFKAEASASDQLFYNHLKTLDSTRLKEVLNLKRKPTSPFFKEPDKDHRIFPGYFTWVMVQENGRNVFKMMRYRVRPKGSIEEIPSKFNVFNARIDSLEHRQTWNKLFTKQHGLFPFKRFFEWVEDDGKKRLVSFAPEKQEIMWAPCLWDYWENPQKTFGFYSFALITDDPPPEVSAVGHDRCPIFLREDFIQDWLTVNRSKEEYYLLLKNLEKVYYINKFAA